MVGSASGPIGIRGFCSSVKGRKKPKNISSRSGCVTFLAKVTPTSRQDRFRLKIVFNRITKGGCRRGRISKGERGDSSLSLECYHMIIDILY
jgi:hypothetical protein